MKELLNPQQLLNDHYSAEAEQNIERILELRAKGELEVIWSCSDARLILPDDVYQVKTISGTGPRSPWAKLLNYDRTLGVIVMDHFDCGGIQARSQLPEKIADEDTALGFVRDHVWANDPIIQSILTGSWTASRTKRTVVSVVQNHLDGSVYPQGVFNNGSQTEHKTIPTYKLMPEEYLPEGLYGDEIPQLDESFIPSSAAHILNKIAKKVEFIRTKYPEVMDLQPVQDPEVIAITTNLKPLSARFPKHFSKPNTVFQVSLARQSFDNEGELSTDDVREAFRQIHYPISYSLEHSSLAEEAPFKSTRVLYIETGDMKVSLGLAKQAQRRLWVQEWLELPDRTIIAAEAIKGKIREIEQVV
ncbi:MAG: hypothetical protein ACD_30C00112G0072 [uncultured bacterium]|uniref:Carbonic anhydrase n=4 Tax=Candidatus Daviesiibacteriota TaxID=1752718 RepID=A0A0G0EYA0_9BACT|nr:MAG: hypothetical protein ACD_30C00112G0072 [uncultured bacterium]KKQ10507.1 MAG: hypothetical protein US19_C0003G0002 [Candidatus Daviesbacteria bacterium GW2011_GWB1_36_5]KKQ14931.1 MAG: hypothetical protein US28_C0026G0009 [Candidatus Daviesbacteria bacterium GW2011_GWA1_36_8]OGE17231.1 MAG: hypothetical protein A2858_00815 [Candidatus Daviesbacteria bacterium RIFCSPHIGHO2_01_FULL_36_37]OGE36012.1 MAG: hypothetical protein A3E66_01810 [Candidatus Daviesbacteria bacterium RIFCSPHIGHO2_12_F